MSRVKILLLSLILLVGMTSVALAQGPNYTITRWTLGSSSTLTDGGYYLSAIAGQAEAGVTLSGGGYTLTGGFKLGHISGGTPPNPEGGRIYLPIVLRNP